ncbi:triphosphoribosyl-dephospho-CoA synthase CitG [Levilactobacillus acidifarinae]|uniref:Probable 2-(5''-triphosphoribosyl)-3'-dephosphocoenzyme-A synthase n=1 Tax=Levilactobacillus acidifarinae DSM 19394 = JCM 15949 TaxID=1423715 RepID=A0A0R1LHL1_9LACO|nr:triphosphoribosyl-dephospho-CoA synthase CitG [Levilactobacillus acidifarinae]KRK95189.1 citG protein [Levilactobacillus acidifarinae DSM 19394]GEO70331.1 putative 2-(5''-triphosphoribosyl)-3'-dephosphocoenzyme-A synthase [Levilactobacillus acidifarinae]
MPTRDPAVLNATRALLYEVSVTPKPGLVDPADVGPHPDMDVFTFIDSATALEDYWTTCFATGRAFTNTALPDLFHQIRPAGVAAEAAMFHATHGVNTHKGAVFSLGVIVAATGYQTRTAPYDTSQVLTTVQAMLHGLTTNDFAGLAQKPSAQLTAGERQYLKYGTTGIRGQAEAGFPVVATVSLPYLRQSQGTRTQRLLNTLLTIVAHTADSNLIKRAGTDTIVPWAQQTAQAILTAGGCQTPTGQAQLTEMNRIFKAKNLSLGGSADLLILTIYFGLMEQIL